MKQYEVREIDSGRLIVAGDKIADNDGYTAMFVGVSDSSDRVVVTNYQSMSRTFGGDNHESWRCERVAADFGLEIVEAPEGFAFWHFSQERLEIRLTDGRTVDLFPDGRIQVWTPDKMHGTEFKIPPDIEHGAELDLAITRLHNTEESE